MKKIYRAIVKTGIIYFLPKKIARSIIKKIKINYIFTDLKKLPPNNYPTNINKEFHQKNISTFLKTKVPNSYCSGIYLKSYLTLLFKKKSKIRLLDFGGENIDLYLYIKNYFSNIRYDIVNQKEISANLNYFKEYYSLNSLNIFNQIPNLNNKYNFIFMGSVIQYIKNWEIILRKLIDNNAEYIYITGLVNFHSNYSSFKKEIIAKQINSFPNINFLYFINEKFLIQLFNKSNYQLIFKEKNFDSNLGFLGFEEKILNIEYSDYLFKKN